MNPDNMSVNNGVQKTNFTKEAKENAAKPTGRPNSKREFQQILGDDDNTDLELELDNAAKTGFLGRLPPNQARGQDTRGGDSSSGLSLFDLPKMSKDKSLDKGKLDANLEKDKVQAFKGIQGDEGSAGSSGSSKSKKNLFDSPFAQSMPDLSFVNPLSTTQQVAPTSGVFDAKVEMVANPSPIQDIVEQMIGKLTILTNNGQTDTSVTLNTPGAFNGAIIVISQYDSANGQLNLAFENLTQQAKLLLDDAGNRSNLLNSLSKEGYVVQQMTTTTIIERAPIIPEAQQEGFAKQQDQDQQQRQQQQEDQEA